MTGKLKEPSLSKIQAIFWIKKKGKEIRNDYKRQILFKNPNCLLTFSLYLIAITSPLVRQANDLSAFSKLCYLLGKVFYIL